LRALELQLGLFSNVPWYNGEKVDCKQLPPLQSLVGRLMITVKDICTKTQPKFSDYTVACTFTYTHPIYHTFNFSRRIYVKLGIEFCDSLGASLCCYFIYRVEYLYFPIVIQR